MELANENMNNRNKLSVRTRLDLWQMKFFHKILGGHICLGPVTIYGLNAMQWGVSIRTKKGFIRFRLPLPCFFTFPPLYFYISPNGTPWAATYIIGGGKRLKRDRILAPLRRYRFGLHFDAYNDELLRAQLAQLNNII